MLLIAVTASSIFINPPNPIEWAFHGGWWYTNFVGKKCEMAADQSTVEVFRWANEGFVGETEWWI